MMLDKRLVSLALEHMLPVAHLPRPRHVELQLQHNNNRVGSRRRTAL